MTTPFHSFFRNSKHKKELHFVKKQLKDVKTTNLNLRESVASEKEKNKISLELFEKSNQLKKELQDSEATIAHLQDLLKKKETDVSYHQQKSGFEKGRCKDFEVCKNQKNK